MTLRHEPDVSAADWIVRADADWGVIAGQGPPGFEAYAQVPFDRDASPKRTDDVVHADVVHLATAHTSTPDDAVFALWEGWGDIEGGDAVSMLYQSPALTGFGRVFRRPRPPRIPPAFDDAVMKAPRADLDGFRAYLLFRGPLSDVGRWGARPEAPDWPRRLAPASFVWPQDRSWCIAQDVDDDSLTIGGSQALVDAVLAHPDLRAEPATYGSPPPLSD